MNSTFRSLSALALFCATFSSMALAQATTQAPKQEPEKPKQEAVKDPKTEEYEKAVKDLKKLEGGFTMYQRKKELLLELPEAKLGQLFLVQSTLHTGVMGDMITAGFPLNFGANNVYKFEKRDDAVWLKQPNLRYRWEKGDPLAIASERSFPEAILGSFRIEATNTEKKLLLVNVTSFFYGDVLRLPEMVQALLMGPYSLEREKSSPEFAKAYPDNTVVRMALHYFNPRPGGESEMMAALGMGPANHLEDPRSAPLKVTYNLWWRKESNYMPRLADQRVGYFTQDFFNVGKFASDDRTDRFINRWNLKKKDPKAALSEPVKPIVWMIDPSVPESYRQATKEGILYWNRAFEALGYKDAVVVREPEKGDDYDHADGRFNVVRWTMSEDAGYAIALARSDPFTGEILNAAVNFDANIAPISDREYRDVAVPGANALERAYQVLNGTYKTQAPGISEERYLFDGNKALYAHYLESIGKKFGWSTAACQYGHLKSQDARAGWQSLAAMSGGRPKVAKDQYVKDFIRDVTSHEVGHCMGLRHNFISSRRNSTKDLENDDLIRSRGITSSVMDYTPTNAMALLKGTGVFFAPRIGEYDMWAIKYGYMEVPGASSPVGEKHALARLASQSGLSQFRFMTDENADSFDPYVVRFDMASDTLNYLKANLELNQRVRRYAVNSLPRAGESYFHRTELLMNSIMRTQREGRLALRYLGGLNGSRAFAGDAGSGSVLAPVSPDEHRQAAQLIAKYCLRPEAFAIPENVLRNMAIDHNMPVVSAWTAPMRSTISGIQSSLVAGMLAAGRVNAISENAYKWGSNPKAYSLHEHYQTVVGAVFGDLESSSIPPLRRDLQRFAVNGLIMQSGAPAGALNEDSKILATSHLRSLSIRYGFASRKAKDEMTATYLKETKTQIDRFLNRLATGL